MGKVLVVNGSPRPDGLVAQWLRAVAEGAREQGHEVEWLDAHGAQVAPCTSCMVCRETEHCILPADDGHRFAELVRASDALVLGTPTYWANMSAQLKLLFDRTAPVFLRERRNGPPTPLQKGKRAVLVTTCNTPWPLSVWFKQSRGATNALRAIMRFGGLKVVGVLEKGNTWDSKGLTAKELARARALGRRL